MLFHHVNDGSYSFFEFLAILLRLLGKKQAVFLVFFNALVEEEWVQTAKNSPKSQNCMFPTKISMAN